MTAATVVLQQQADKPATVFLGKAEVRRRLGGMSRSTLWRLARTDPRFPKPARLLAHDVWPEDEIERYARTLLAERDGGEK